MNVYAILYIVASNIENLPYLFIEPLWWNI